MTNRRHPTSETAQPDRLFDNNSHDQESGRDRSESFAVIAAVSAVTVALTLWLIALLLPQAETLLEMAFILAMTAGISGLGIGFVIGWALPRRIHTADEAAADEVDEEENSEEEKLFGYIIDSMEGGVMTTSADGMVTSFNGVAEKTLGRQSKSVVGRHFGAVFPDAPENAQIRRMIHSALCDHRTFSSVEVSAALPSGGQVSLGVTISPLRGGDGPHQGLVILFKNLAELKRLRERVEQTDQLASLGRLSAGMAHEIRNPLGSLHGLVELIGEDLEPDDPRWRYIHTILNTIDQLNELVENLLEFAQPPIGDREPHDVRTIVRHCVEMCRLDTGDKEVEVEYDQPEQPIYVTADRERLGRAMINILRNAFQATPEGGTVRTVVRRAPSARADSSEHVVIEVRNTGSYVSPVDREKLFTPFFTTRPGGTGLGLPIAQQIISAHDGVVELDSDPDRGTTFHVFLPVAFVGTGNATSDREQGTIA